MSSSSNTASPGFEGAETGVGEAAFEGAAGAFGVFDVNYLSEPRLVQQSFGLGEQAVEAEFAQALARDVKSQHRCRVVHRYSPWQDLRNR